MTIAKGQGSPFHDWTGISPVWKGHTQGPTLGRPGVGMKRKLPGAEHCPNQHKLNLLSRLVSFLGPAAFLRQPLSLSSLTAHHARPSLPLYLCPSQRIP
jgi:hypothetical protein